MSAFTGGIGREEEDGLGWNGLVPRKEEESWRITAQVQTDHQSGFCTLSTAIRYPGGELQVNQRIADSAEGYAEGKQRIDLIVSAVNAAYVQQLKKKRRMP